MTVTTLPAFDGTMAALGISAPPDEWRAPWEAIQVAFPVAGLPCLVPHFLDDLNETCHYAEDILDALREAIMCVRGDERLARLAWLWHSLLIAPDAAALHVLDWPRPTAIGPAAEMFPAVVLLMQLPRLIAQHRECGIPAAVTRATCRDLEVWMRHALRTSGAWGFTRLAWMQHHCAGRLYRLGRLQFIHKPFTGAVRVYRHRGTGTVLALSAPGVRYRRDGLLDGTNGRVDAGAWTATLDDDGIAVRGFPLHPTGHALQAAVTLPRGEWESVLAEGDPILDMHIPEDGPMDHAQCGEALRQALAFFPRYFPELPPARAFFCYSWLLDAQYEQLLPPNSNIVRFLREFYCFPACTDDLDPFFRVFGGKPADLHAAPRDTTLRRAMLDFTLAGGALHLASAFILIDGLQWGAAPYRAMHPDRASVTA